MRDNECDAYRDPVYTVTDVTAYMIELPMAPLVPSEPMADDEEQTVLGFRQCHEQVISLAQQIFAAAAQVGAVTRLLHARGLIDDAELAEYRRAEEQRLEKVFQKQHIGVRIGSTDDDKYAVTADQIPQIDCASRYHLCHAACCALRFPLTKQDLDEGVVRWELGQPYLNRQGLDRLCVHLDRGTRRCSIYQHRPSICRTYDCRQDSRIWADFDKGIINPDLFVRTENGSVIPQFPLRKVAPEDGVDLMDAPTAPAPEHDHADGP